MCAMVTLLILLMATSAWTQDVWSLTTAPGDDEAPVWSADGAWIAFSSARSGNDDVWIMGPQGENPRQVTQDPGPDVMPSWSPDGRKIAFSSGRHRVNYDDRWEIYTIDIVDGSTTRLTDTPHIDDAPVWSPDGRFIAFHSHRAGLDIWRMLPDGSNQVNLTADNGLEDTFPAWSPDGETIAFCTRESSGATSVHLIDYDGTNERAISNLPCQGRPAWSPAGHLLAVPVPIIPPPHSWQVWRSDIHIIDVATEQHRPVRVTSNSDEFPSWHPSGDRLVFESWPSEGGEDIWVMRFPGFAALQTVAIVRSWGATKKMKR